MQAQRWLVFSSAAAHGKRTKNNTPPTTAFRSIPAGVRHSCLTTTALLYAIRGNQKQLLRLPIRLARVPAPLELTDHRAPAPRSQYARFRETGGVTGHLYMQCKQQRSSGSRNGRTINVQQRADCINATVTTLDDRCFTHCGRDSQLSSPLRSRCPSVPVFFSANSRESYVAFSPLMC